MKSHWLAGLVCVVTLAAMVLSAGCSNPVSADRNRRRAYVVQTDLDHMTDDIDWALGLDEPSILYEDSFPPYGYGRLAR